MKPEQITAWALDEASAEERQQLEAALLENPQDKQKAEETKAFCDFLLSELRDDSLALTDKQRERLVEQSSRLPAASGTLALPSEAGASGTLALQAGEQASRLRSNNNPRRPQTKWRIGIIVRLAVAACVALGGFWTWQSYLQKQRDGSASVAVVAAEKPDIKVQLAAKPDAKKKAGQGPEARLLVEKQNKALVKMEAPAGKPLAGKPLAPASMPAAVAGSSALALNKEQRVMTAGDVEKLKRIQDQNAYALNFGEKMAAPVAEMPVVPVKKAELAEVAAAPAAVGGSGLLAGTRGMMQQGTGTVTLNGGGALTVGGAVSGSTGGIILSAVHESAGSMLAPEGTDFWGANAFIHLRRAPEGRTGRLTLFMNHWISLKGIVIEPWTSYFWPMGWSPSGLAANSLELVYLPAGDSLAEYQASVNVDASKRYPYSGASLVLKSANSSTGSVMVQAGAPVTMNAILQLTQWPMIHVMDYKTLTVGSDFVGWTMLDFYENTRSAGVISFATAADSQLNDARDSGSISAEDQHLLGGLLSRDHVLSGNPAARADASGVSDLQAAVFNVTAVSNSSSSASTVLGSGGVVVKGGVFNSTGKQKPLIQMDKPTFYSGMMAPTEVTGKFYSAGAIVVPNRTSFTFDGSSAAAWADAPAAQAGMPADAGALIANGNVVAPSKPQALTLTGGTTVSNRAEPTMTFGNTASIRGYMASNRSLGAGMTVATSVEGTNSLTVGQDVTATPLTRNVGATVVLGDVAAVSPMTEADTGAVVSMSSGKNTLVVGQAVSGTGLPVGTTTGTITADSFSNTFTGGVTVSRGAMIHGGNVSTGGNRNSGAGESTPSAGTTFAGTLSSTTGNTGAGASLTKSGAGTLTLAGATTINAGTSSAYTGTTTISGGTLTLAAESEQRRHSGIAAGGMKLDANAPAQASRDLNSFAFATAAAPQPLAGSPSALGGWAVTGKEFATLNEPVVVQKPQPVTAAAGGNLATDTPLRLSTQTAATTVGGTISAAVPTTPAMPGAAGGAAAPAAPEEKPVALVVSPKPGAVDQVQSGLLLAGGSVEVGNYDAAIAQYQNVLRTDPYNTAARRGMEDAEKKRLEYFKTAYYNQRAKMLAQVSEPWGDKVPVQTGEVTFSKDAKTDAFYLGANVMPEERKAERQSQPSSGESYTRIIENEMKEVAREPLSTLSIDVDTASYANVRRFLNQNMIPPPDAVRIEELVNYFPTAEEGPAHEAKEPFAVRVELAPCPWQPVHRLARISIKGREMDKDRKASNLVFLVDVSGSMNEPAKLPLVQQSLRMLTSQLGEGDRVTMVVYAGSSGVVLPPTNGEKKAEILAAIDRLSAGGSTHGSAGIKLAYEQAVAGFIKGGVNRVILCTDGDFNVGVSSPEELEKLIKHKAKTGVFLSVLGFGSGNLQDRTMETLADKGNGNYAYIDSLSEARKVLVEQMGSTLDTIAKDVKIQVEFNPAAVRSYRLIGYENRLLAKEDFNDDTKDAGEIGAGHSVVALYEIVPSNLPAGADGRPAVDSLKYQAPAITPAQLVEAAKSGETMTVKLRYKAPDSDLSKLIEVPTKDAGKTLTASTEEFKFSAAVAGFGLLLRDSAYKGTLSWETVRRLALDGKGADKLGYRGEFLQLIDKARGLKETR